jgi:hypothetical protein
MNWLDEIEVEFATERRQSAVDTVLKLTAECRRLRRENGWLNRRLNKHEPQRAMKAVEARMLMRQVDELTKSEKAADLTIDGLRTELKIWKARAAQKEGPRVRAELPAEPEKHWTEEEDARPRYDVLPLP